jgi:TAT (twin-arginine translocation) pathway signal sequence
MSESTRRSFVKSSAGAAAGMTVLGALVTQSAEAKSAQHAKPIVAYIHDARTGEISLNTGERTVKFRDRKIAAQLAHAAR